MNRRIILPTYEGSQICCGNGGGDPGSGGGGGGGNPGSDPGGNPGSDPGGDPGSDPGGDPGGDPGSDPGGNPGGNPGSDPGGNPGGNPGGGSDYWGPLPAPPSADNNDPNPRFGGRNPDSDNEVTPGIITNPTRPIADDDCPTNTNTFDRYHRYKKVVSGFVSNQEIWDGISVGPDGTGEKYDGDANYSSSLKIITTPEIIIYHSSFSSKSEVGQATFWSYSGGGTAYDISPVKTESGKYLGNITVPGVSSYVKPENWGTTFMFFWNPSEETMNKLVEMLCAGAVAVSYQISQGDGFPNNMKLNIYFKHLRQTEEYDVGDIEYFQGSMPLSNICYGNPGEVSCEDEPGIPENFPININIYGPILNLQESWAVP